MIFTSDELWILATCMVCAAACAIPGAFLMLRRETLLGDAISHSVLPGLVAGFMATGSRNPAVMLIGAFTAGLLTVFLTALISSIRTTKRDAALGMVYTSLFALGVLLVSIAARNVDIDPGCILYGLVEFAPLDTMIINGGTFPKSFLSLLFVFLLNALLATLFFKEISLVTFDQALARSLGFNASAIHYGLMATTTVTVVAAFEAVGSILVVSMLAVPAATAYLLTDRLSQLVLLSIAVGCLSALGGLSGAIALNTSVAGMMGVTAGGLFFTAFLFAPRHGVLTGLARRIRLQVRITQDDILGILFRFQEQCYETSSRRPLTVSDISKLLARGRLTSYALQRVLSKGYLVKDPGSGGLRLTERGLVEARALIRSHRLWESYLAKHLGLPADHLHAPSERAEHYIGRALARELQKDLSTTEDPHGRKIP